MSLTDSLISWWTLDETSGTRGDSHGSNDLADNNTVLYTTGVQGNAADFERGNSEYLSIADNSDLSIGSSDFTFASWVRIETKVSSGNTAIIASKKGNTSSNSEWQLLYARDENRFIFGVFNGSSYYSVNTTDWPDIETWYFLTVWYDASEGDLYIQMDAATPDSNTSGPTSLNDGTYSFNIGRSNSGDYWDGEVDEAAFWKRVLTDAERGELYNSGSGVTYSDITITEQAVAGTLGLSGALSRKTNISVAGALGLSGYEIKTIAKNLVGSLGLSGDLSAGYIFIKAVSGVISFTGEVSKKALKSVVGALGLAGVLSYFKVHILNAVNSLVMPTDTADSTVPKVDE